MNTDNNFEYKSQNKASFNLNEENDNYIIAIGASAGGLEAIHEFFDNLPSDTGFSFVVIQHLSPDHKSLIADLLSRHTKMNVQDCEHNSLLLPNTVYVIPSRKLMTIKNRRFILTDKIVSQEPNKAIDIFLNSLAEDVGSKAVAVILSGTGSDGTQGIQAIKSKGGHVIIQEPLSAKFDGMPNNAISTGFGDSVLTPELMPEEIINFTSNPESYKTGSNLISKEDEILLPQVFRLIQEQTSIDFSHYKKPTIIRRLAKRMSYKEIPSLRGYLSVIMQDPAEIDSLCNEFLIGVTRFFRDQDAFDEIRNKVLPEILKDKSVTNGIKVWVPACSTGEEAYSLAILFSEYLEPENKDINVKIFATDIDKKSLEFASKGCYSYKDILHISQERLSKFFIKEDEKYRICPQIRKMVIFAYHDMVKDPPFSRMDLVSCRNFLIYLNPLLQKKSLSVFHFSLNLDGFLFLGPSENLGELQSSFLEIDKKWKIYKNIHAPKLPLQERFLISDHSNFVSVNPPHKKRTNQFSEVFMETAWEELGYAGFYIDENYKIIEAIGDFKRFIILPEKRLDLNLLKMVPEDVSVNLMAAVRRAIKNNQKVVVENLKIRGEENPRLLNIIIKPFLDSNLINRRCILLIFSETKPSVTVKHLDNNNLIQGEYSKIKELEEEIIETKHQLQAAIEEIETSNEELQSSNEELISSNEELQSTNEELQSLNEELHTVNSEHQAKIKELIELNEDLNNYFRSSDIGQVFLDRNLIIRKFTPAIIKQINLIQSDLGRPIHHISNNIKYNNLINDINQVLSTSNPIEREIQVMTGKWFLMKIIPYLKFNNTIEGLIITFLDIDQLRNLNHLVSGVLNSSQDCLMAFKSVRDENKKIVDFRYTLLNQSALKLLDKNEKELVGKRIIQETCEEIHTNLFSEYVKIVEENKLLSLEYKFEEADKKGWFSVVGVKMDDGFVITLADITVKKTADQKINLAYNDLKEAQERLQILNDQLEERVKERTIELSLSEERFNFISIATNDVIWDWDLKSNKIWWNKNFTNLFGYAVKDIEPGIESWFNRIHPDERNKIINGIHNIISNGGKQWTDEYRFLKADGSYAYILDRGYAIYDNKGKPYRIVGSKMDVTQLRRVEEELMSTNKKLLGINKEFMFVTDFMPQLVWATRNDGYHDFYNQRWYDYTGLSKEDSLDKGWSLVVHPDDYERSWNAWKHSLETGEPYQIEYRFRKYDGSYRWFLGRALPLKDEDGEIFKWFGTCTDIHDQKINMDNLAITKEKLHLINLELSAKNEELMKINNDLDNFIYTASHDLKAPVSNIEGLVLTLDSELENKSDNTNFIFQLIKESIERFKNTIKDLTEITKIQKNVDEEVIYISIKDIMVDVLGNIRDMIHSTHAQVNIDITACPEIKFSKKNLKSILYNLISNGIKYKSPERTPILTVKTQRSDNSVLLIVTDNGLGIPEDKIDKIFGMFKRLHDHVDGSGVGLYIVKRIIDNAGGKIDVTSKVGVGTTFKIYFPQS